MWLFCRRRLWHAHLALSWEQRSAEGGWAHLLRHLQRRIQFSFRVRVVRPQLKTLPQRDKCRLNPPESPKRLAEQEVAPRPQGLQLSRALRILGGTLRLLAARGARPRGCCAGCAAAAVLLCSARYGRAA